MPLTRSAWMAAVILLFGAATPAHSLDVVFEDVTFKDVGLEDVGLEDSGPEDADLKDAAPDTAGFEVSLGLPGLFSHELNERLERGLPFTLHFELELMRSRRRWFDSQVAQHAYLLKVDFDPWTRVYSFRSPDSEVEEADTAAVRRLIENHTLSFPLDDRPDTSRTYYFSVRATLKLLTADDIREVEEWLGGHMRRRSLFDLPAGLLGIFKDAAGLGDESATARSADFRIRNGEVVLRGRD